MSKRLRPLWQGLRLICPVCERGRIYRSLTVMHAQCPHCHVTFEAEEGDFVGAMVIAYTVTAVLVCIGIFLVEVFTNLSAAQHALLWSLFATLFLLLTYRNMKGLWLGILHVMVGLRRRSRSR